MPSYSIWHWWSYGHTLSGRDVAPKCPTAVFAAMGARNSICDLLGIFAGEEYPPARLAIGIAKHVAVFVGHLHHVVVDHEVDDRALTRICLVTRLASLHVNCLYFHY